MEAIAVQHETGKGRALAKSTGQFGDGIAFDIKCVQPRHDGETGRQGPDAICANAVGTEIEFGDAGQF